MITAKDLLCISSPRKKSDLVLSLVVHSMVKSLSLYCLHQNSLTVPTWGHRTEKWQKLPRKCCHQIWCYFSHPACFVYWNWTDTNQQTDVSFIWKKKIKWQRKNSQAKADNFSETQGQKNGRVISFSVFYWFKQMKPHYKASLLRLLIDELSYCRYEKRDILSTDEQH